LTRIAAVGDVHIGTHMAGTLRPSLEGVPDKADLLLLAGDLTVAGGTDEAETLIGELQGLALPIIAVLGNHDHHRDQVPALTAILEGGGIEVLEGSSIVVRIAGRAIGVAGTIGFCGGFAPRIDFGERAMKEFTGRTRTLADHLETNLRALARCDVRIALLHYSPVISTLMGERLELLPYLGSLLLEEAIERSGADLVIHGHSHHGAEHGATRSGIPVRNVARTVLARPYAIYEV
jgi:Icc-related predicted phosphoesterase